MRRREAPLCVFCVDRELARAGELVKKKVSQFGGLEFDVRAHERAVSCDYEFASLSSMIIILCFSLDMLELI